MFRVQRGKDRVRLPMGSPEPFYISQSFGILVPEGGLRPCMAEFLPGTDGNSFYPEQYPGVEMVYVLSGTLAVKRNGEHYDLGPRDVMYVAGETERSYRCGGDVPAKALIISFDADTGEPRRAGKRRDVAAALNNGNGNGASHHS